MAWNIVNKTYPYQLRSTVQQTDEGLLLINPRYRVGSMGERGGVISAAVDLPIEGMIVRRGTLQQRGALGSVGIGFRWANRTWIAGQWTDAAGTPFADDTADAQDGPGATADFQLTTTTINDGFVIASTRPFDWVSIRVVTAEAIGVGVTHAVRYTNFAGSGWTAVDANSVYLDEFTGAIAYPAGELNFVWQAPSDWGRTQASGLSGIPGGYYALNIRATDAPDTTGGVASVIEVGTMPIITEDLAALGVYEQEQATTSDQWADALVAFFETADGGNSVYAEVTTGS